MSGHGGGGTGVGKVLGFVILVIVVLFIIWYYTGGPERANTANPFQKPLAPIDTGETYGPGDIN
jgi:hypothetical protein